MQNSKGYPHIFWANGHNGNKLHAASVMWSCDTGKGSPEPGNTWKNAGT